MDLDLHYVGKKFSRQSPKRLGHQDTSIVTLYIGNIIKSWYVQQLLSKPICSNLFVHSSYNYTFMFLQSGVFCKGHLKLLNCHFAILSSICIFLIDGQFLSCLHILACFGHSLLRYVFSIYLISRKFIHALEMEQKFGFFC